MKMLVNFTIIDGSKHTLKPEVVEVTQPYASRPDVYRTASGDIFKCKSTGSKFRKLMRRHRCDVVAVA